MTLLLKIAALHSATLRDLVSSVWKVFVVSMDDKLMVATREAGQLYATKTRADGRNHGLGSPLPHIWLAAVQVLATDSRLSSLQRRLWRRYIKKELMLCPEQVLRHVTHFKVRPAFDKKFGKIFFSADPTFEITFSGQEVGEDDSVSLVSGEGGSNIKLSELVVDSLRAIGGVQKFGPAPKGDLERQLQKVLDKAVPLTA